MRAEQITDPVTYHGEAPVWIDDSLVFVDMLDGDVLRLMPAGSLTRRHVAPIVAAVRPRRRGGLVYAVERGFAVDDGPGTPVRALPPLWSDPHVRMNEGGCDPAGAFWCGSMAYDAAADAGALYRLDPDGSATLVEDGWTIPNGLGWSPDGAWAYHADTVRGRIDRLAWDPERGLHHRQPFAQVEGGRPDGLTVAADGGVWAAIWGAGAVHHLTPDGRLAEVIELPVAQVSACTFGGERLETLFITTSRESLADPEPAAGAVFALDVGVPGLPVLPYGG
jgi:sugar lactone lactonase YvrE